MMGRGPDPVIEIDAETRLGDMGASMWDFISVMEPFGAANPKPVFMSRGVTPSEVKTIGSTGKHLRMTIEDDGRRVGAIGFNLATGHWGEGKWTSFTNCATTRGVVVSGKNSACWTSVPAGFNVPGF